MNNFRYFQQNKWTIVTLTLLVHLIYNLFNKIHIFLDLLEVKVLNLAFFFHDYNWTFKFLNDQSTQSVLL